MKATRSAAFCLTHGKLTVKWDFCPFCGEKLEKKEVPIKEKIVKQHHEEPKKDYIGTCKLWKRNAYSDYPTKCKGWKSQTNLNVENHYCNQCEEFKSL